MPDLWVTTLAVLGSAGLLSLMAASLAVVVRPGILSLLGRWVCPSGTKMVVQSVKASYHRPGERGLVAICEGRDISRLVTGRAFLSVWLLSFAVVLPLAALLAVALRVCL
jgi:hypothetical protein